MKRKLLLMGFIFSLINMSASLYAQQMENGWPMYFKTAWSYQWSGGAWVQQGRIKPTYDANKHLVSAVAQANISGTWISAERWTLTYNSNGQLWVNLDEKFDGTKWNKYQIDSSSYNTDGTCKSKLVYRTVSGVMTKMFLNNYYYNSNKVLTFNHEVDWNTTTNSWENDDNYYYYYNANGSLDRINDSNWIGKWAMWRRDTVNYNADNSVKEVVSQALTSGVWTNVSKITFDSATVTGIAAEEKLNGVAHVYPNPSTGMLQIVLPAGVKEAEISIYDISGRLVMHLPKQSSSMYSVPFSLASLKAGSYFLVCTTNEGILNAQLIRQ